MIPRTIVYRPEEQSSRMEPDILPLPGSRRVERCKTRKFALRGERIEQSKWCSRVVGDNGERDVERILRLGMHTDDTAAAAGGSGGPAAMEA